MAAPLPSRLEAFRVIALLLTAAAFLELAVQIAFANAPTILGPLQLELDVTIGAGLLLAAVFLVRSREIVIGGALSTVRSTPSRSLRLLLALVCAIVATGVSAALVLGASPVVIASAFVVAVMAAVAAGLALAWPGTRAQIAAVAP